MICPLALVLSAALPVAQGEVHSPTLTAYDHLFGSEASSNSETVSGTHLGLVPGHVVTYGLTPGSEGSSYLSLLMIGTELESPVPVLGQLLALEPSNLFVAGSGLAMPGSWIEWTYQLSPAMSLGAELSTQAALVDLNDGSLKLTGPLRHVVTAAQPEVISQLAVSAHPAAVLEEPSTLLVESAAQWEIEWAKCEVPGPAPSVDFDREVVAMVFSGYQPTGGYSILIEGVEALTPGASLQARLTIPGPGCLVTLATTAPSCFVRMDRVAAGATLETDVGVVLNTSCEEVPAVLE